jgi:hypothetical protein
MLQGEDLLLDFAAAIAHLSIYPCKNPLGLELHGWLTARIETTYRQQHRKVSNPELLGKPQGLAACCSVRANEELVDEFCRRSCTGTTHELDRCPHELEARSMVYGRETHGEGEGEGARVRSMVSEQ